MTVLLGDLMSAAVNADPLGDVADFSKRKAVSVHAPYETEDLFAYLKFEDKDSIQSSLIIDAKLGAMSDLMAADA
jgi:hypothetical protein